MEATEQRIIKLTGGSVSDNEPRMKRARFADVVIDHKGKVIKDRYGPAGRWATPEELAEAVDA